MATTEQLQKMKDNIGETSNKIIDLCTEHPDMSNVEIATTLVITLEAFISTLIKHNGGEFKDSLNKLYGEDFENVKAFRQKLVATCIAVEEHNSDG
jgi:hypothetical protein